MNTETQIAFESFLPIFEFGLQKLTGSEQRIYLAEIAKQLGYGGMKLAQESFGIDHKTLQKGMEELESGNYISDAFHKRRRKGIEMRLPNILGDIKDIVYLKSQTNPRFEDSHLFTRLTPEKCKKLIMPK